MTQTHCSSLQQSIRKYITYSVLNLIESHKALVLTGH